jgi:hypothetical protein
MLSGNEQTQSEKITIYKPKSSDLDIIYGTEFASLYLNHTLLEADAERFKNDEMKKITFYSDVFFHATVSMNYVNELSSGVLIRITGIRPAKSTFTDKLTALVYARYFSLVKIQKQYETKLTYAEQLKFLTHVYVNSYAIGKSSIKRLRAFSSNNIHKVNISYKINNALIKSEIEKLVKEYDRTGIVPVIEEKKVIESMVAGSSAKPEKPKKEKPKKSTSDIPSAPLERMENKENERFIAAVSKLHFFEGSYEETKRSFNNLEGDFRALNDACQQLQTKLQKISKLDIENIYLSKERIQLIQAYGGNIESQIVTVKNSLLAAINALEYRDKNKLAANEQALAAIKTKIAELRANQDKLATEIQEHAFFLDHVIPKKTPKELAIEALRLKKEKEKADKESKQAEENARRAAAKVARPRPPTRPQPLVRALVQAPSPAKTEYKRPVTVAQSASDEEKASTRIQHLNQASKNLLYIHKMLEMYLTELPPVIVHYALLYNIFRCFQSLLMYQSCGGNNQSINSDEVINLRNMIMHHGASTAKLEDVIAFAKDIKGKLSNVLAEMKGKNAYIISHELSYEDRQGLLEFSGFAPHNNLVIEECTLYKKLQRFHESKQHNHDAVGIFNLVCEKYIPKMREILAKINKQNPFGVAIVHHVFVLNYLFDLQALRMLATMCGEFLHHFEDYQWTSIYPFLKNCRLEVRNPVAHQKQDNFNPVDFYLALNGALAKVDENKFLAMVTGDSQKSVPGNSATFFQPANNSGSAMDAKYDTPSLR